MLSDGSRDWQSFFIAAAALVVMLAYVFSCDYKNGAIGIVRSTRNGKSVLVLRKVLISAFLLIITYVLVYFPYFLNFTSTYGTEILSTPLPFVSGFQNVGAAVSVWQYLRKH